jgi:hypothetical protein
MHQDPWVCKTCGLQATERGRAKGQCVKCYRADYRKAYRANPENAAKERSASAEYYKANKAEFNAKITASRRRLKSRIFAAMGGKCVCCGETEPMFLTLDHVQNDGYLVRKVARHLIYRRAELEGLPKDRYQVLCWNCNAAKGLFGSCPHTSNRKT